MGKRKVDLTKQSAPVAQKQTPKASKETLKSGRSQNKPDMIRVLTMDEQAEFHEKYELFLMQKALSVQNDQELVAHEDNFAPQKTPPINKVTQTIPIEQEYHNETTDTSSLQDCRNMTVKMRPCKLEYQDSAKLNLSQQQLNSKLLDSARQSYSSKRLVPQSELSVSLGTTQPILPNSKPRSRTLDLEASAKSLKSRLKEPQPEKAQAEWQPKNRAKTKKELAYFDNLKLLSECINQLQENALPDEIYCRDEEKAYITKFIEEGIKNGGQAQALYISGVPGIGKTATVMEVKSKLLAQNKKFHFLYANAMNFGSPETIYTALLEQLVGPHKLSKAQACIALNDLFTKGHFSATHKNLAKALKKGNRVFLIDECDNLVTPNQQVLYNLVDWPSYKESKLTVIMIANTMDFPEKLKPKIQSRLGSHRLVFKPYFSAQIETIINQRLEQQQQAFSAATINYIGKKIATISTDIRKTLGVCRVSVEIAKEEYERTKTFRKIDIEHVKQAYNKIYDKAYHIGLKHFSSNQKYILIAVALEINHKGYNLAFLQSVANRFNQINKQKSLSYQELRRELLLLQDANILEMKESMILQQRTTNQLKQITDDLQRNDGFHNICDVSIQLKISTDDIKNGLAQNEQLKEFLNLI